MSFDLISENLQNYCNENTSSEGVVLNELNRQTHLNVLQPRMLSGHFQGRLLSMISQMIKPKYILELGTYTGYSAICLAEGLLPDGKLITIDCNPENETLVNEFINQSGYSNKITTIIGDAYQVLRTLTYPFDLVFIDADKPNYEKYYELVIELIPSGSFILLDNMLWSGKVLDPEKRIKDKDTKNLHQLNQKINADKRVQNILLPIRDGIMLVKKN